MKPDGCFFECVCTINLFGSMFVKQLFLMTKYLTIGWGGQTGVLFTFELPVKL